MRLKIKNIATSRIWKKSWRKDLQRFFTREKNIAFAQLSCLKMLNNQVVQKSEWEKMRGEKWIIPTEKIGEHPVRTERKARHLNRSRDYLMWIKLALQSKAQIYSHLFISTGQPFIF